MSNQRHLHQVIILSSEQCPLRDTIGNELKMVGVGPYVSLFDAAQGDSRIHATSDSEMSHTEMGLSQEVANLVWQEKAAEAAK